MTTTYIRSYLIGRDNWLEQLGEIFDIHDEALDEIFEIVCSKVNASLPGSYVWIPMTSEVIGDVDESEEIELEDVTTAITDTVNVLANDEDFLNSIMEDRYEKH